MEEREALWGAQRVYTEIVAPWDVLPDNLWVENIFAYMERWS